MPKENRLSKNRIDRFFSGARADRWRDLIDAANARSDGAGDRAKFEANLSGLTITEDVAAQPRESAAKNDRRSKERPGR
jgi:hypothetical protein